MDCEHDFGEWFTVEVRRIDWDYVQGYREHGRAVQQRRCNKCGWAQEAPMGTFEPGRAGKLEKEEK